MNKGTKRSVKKPAWTKVRLGPPDLDQVIAILKSALRGDKLDAPDEITFERTCSVSREDRAGRGTGRGTLPLSC